LHRWFAGMNEAETRAEHIDPALKAAGWGVVAGSRIRRANPMHFRGEGKTGGGKLLQFFLFHCPNRRPAFFSAELPAAGFNFPPSQLSHPSNHCQKPPS
jgi:hypothetical protein